MFKNSFKAILAVVLLLGLSTSAFAAVEVITGNNSFATAHSMGNWKYHSSTICKLEAGQDEAYFSFIAYAGDRVYARASYDLDYEGMAIFTYNNHQVPVDEGYEVVDPTSILPFLFANVDATSNAQTFFIKVTRGNYTGDMLFSISIENRISSGNGTFNFTGTAVNSGNPDILKNPDGVDSTVITMDLTRNSNIPNGAIVKSINTTGTLSGRVSGEIHKILSDETNTWHTAVVGGRFGISLSDNLEVAHRWSFKYNVKAKNSSSLKKVKAAISYEFDKTEQFNTN